jgi:hypothetical protein
VQLVEYLLGLRPDVATAHCGLPDITSAGK